MSTQELHIGRNLLPSDPEEIRNIVEAGHDEAGSHALQLALSLGDECLRLAEPSAMIRRMAALPSEKKSVIRVDNEEFLVGKVLSAMLEGSEAYFFFAVSPGPGPENLAKKHLDSGNYLEGYMVDLLASSMAESVAEEAHKQIKEIAAGEGLKITNRYSPGYCGWKVSEQHKLFALLPGNSCGITLSPSALMSPIKSVSGVIGAGKAVQFKDYTCELCTMTNCKFRKVNPE